MSGRTRAQVGLRDASEEQLGSIEFMLRAVQRNGFALEFASEAVRDNEDVVQRAVSHFGPALAYASERLRGDLNVVMCAVGTWGYALEYAADALRDHTGVVMLAISASGEALQYASERLRGETDVVMHAVSKRGSALQYAAEALRGMPVIVLRAVAQQSDAFMYASLSLRADREFVQRVISQPHCGYALEHASTELRDDEAMMRLAVEHECTGMWLSVNRRVTLSYASPKWCSDKKFVKACIARHCVNWRFMAADLKRDRDLLLAAFRSAHLNRQMRFTLFNRQMQRHVVDQMDPSFHADKQVMLAAVDCKAAWYLLAAPQLQRDPDMLRATLATGCRSGDDDDASITSSELQKVLAAVPEGFRNGKDYRACTWRARELADREFYVENDTFL